MPIEVFLGEWLLQGVVEFLGGSALTRAAARDLSSALDRVSRQALERTSDLLLGSGEDAEDRFLARAAIEQLLDHPPVTEKDQSRSVLDGLTQRSRHLAGWLNLQEDGNPSALAVVGVSEAAFAETLEQTLIDCLVAEAKSPDSPLLPFWVDLEAGRSHHARTEMEQRWQAAMDDVLSFMASAAAPPVLAEALNPVEVQLDGSESLTQLVRPTRRAVPYQAPAHLEWLVNWATDRDTDDAVKVAVVHGAGGTGKTRLCVELGVVLTEGNWVTGFVPRGIQGSVDEAVFAALERSSGDTLVVVDYADGRTTDDLLRLLAAARSRSGEGRLRVVLSSRQDLGWWHRLEALMAESGMTIETMVLDELKSMSQLGGRVASAALRRFGVASRDLMVTDDWVMLDLVLAAALLSVDPGTEVPASRAALYREVLSHEYKSWDTKSLNEMSEADWEIAAAAITLVAPETRRDAGAVVAAAGVEAFLQGRAAPTSAIVDSFVARWGEGDLHSYSEGLALRPDRVGDHLVRTITSTDTKLVGALLDWIGELGATQVDKAIELAERLVTNASRAALEDDHVTQTEAQHLYEALTLIPVDDSDTEDWVPHPVHVALGRSAARGDRFAAQIVTVMVNRGTTRLQTFFAPLREARLPSLAGVRAALAEQLPELESDEPVQRAAALLELGVSLSEMGRRGDALAPTEDAVTLYRELAADNPAYLPDLAGSLNNLGARLSDLGRRGDALAPTEEAVTLYRELAADNPAYLPDLAGSLNNLGIRLSELGRRNDALAPTEEAVTLRRELTADNPAYLPNLAMSLNNLGNRLSELGRRDDALAPTEEAVTLYRELTANNPAYLPDLAGSLNNLGTSLSELGRRNDALAPTEEAVTLRRELTADNPAYLPDLASSLNNLGAMLSGLGRRDDALAPTEEAVTLYRELTADNPAYLPDLAMSLNNLGIRLSELGRRDDALAPTEEAVTLYRELAADNPAYLPDLAGSLNNLGIRLSELGRRNDALAPTEEAVTLRRELAADNPAYLPDLAASLNNLGAMLSGLGRRDDALAPTEEAVTLRRELTADNPAYLPDLAMSLNNLGAMLSGLGRRNDALAPTEEAVTLYRELAADNPGYLPDLAASLNNLGAMLSGLGRRGDALAPTEEAVTLRRELTADNPAHLPDLAGSLNNLGIRLSELGRRADALAPTEEAVTLRRELAADNPAYLPDLAASLNNLGTRLSELGRRADALAPTEEAVTLRRELTADNPAYLPDLAGSLNNLGAMLSELGHRDHALAPTEEAVTLYRELTANNPAYLPDLAMSLNNLGNRLSELGHRDHALAPTEEAVTLYRELTANNPAYLPDLAGSLNNLGIRLSGLGRRNDALAPTEEAVTLYRELTANNPAYLPNLAMSLNNLGTKLSEVGRAGEVIGAWTDSATELAAPADGWLLTRALTSSFFDTNVKKHLATQALTTLQNDNAVQPRILGEARRALADAVADFQLDLGDQPLPDWLAITPDEKDYELANTWDNAKPGELGQALETYRNEIAADAQQHSLHSLAERFPGTRFATEWTMVTEHDDINEALSALIAQDKTSHLLGTWISTPTWSESQEFFEAHQDDLTSDLSHALLQHAAKNDDRAAHQHLALLTLCSDTDSNAVFAGATDVGTALSHANQALAAGRLPVVLAWATLNQRILQLQPDGVLLQVALLLHQQPDAPTEHPEIADAVSNTYAQASQVERDNARARLTKLASHEEHAPIAGELLAWINEPPTTTEPTIKY